MISSSVATVRRTDIRPLAGLAGARFGCGAHQGGGESLPRAQDVEQCPACLKLKHRSDLQFYQQRSKAVENKVRVCRGTLG